MNFIAIQNPKFISLLNFILIHLVISYTQASEESELNTTTLALRILDNYNADAFLSTVEIIQKYGYPVESHTVVTKDGYILTMYRIPHGRIDDSNTSISRPPVLFHHGLFCDGMQWVVNTPDKNTAFILADLGYDIWIANVRGSRNSRKHTSLSDRKRKYWDFSMDHMGKYDIPAEIDYVLEINGQPKLFYIGHSMGCILFFMAMSLFPDYNQKVRLMIAEGPAVYVDHIGGLAPVAKIFPKKLVRSVIKLISPKGEIPVPWLTPILHTFWTNVCQNIIVSALHCEIVGWLIGGKSENQTQSNLSPVFFHSFPQQTSTNTFGQFLQYVFTGTFQHFDYDFFGERPGNKAKYGSKIAPMYYLNRTTVPVAVFWGNDDTLVTPQDASRVADELANVILRGPVPAPTWNHFDFIIGNDLNEVINKPIIDLFLKY